LDTHQTKGGKKNPIKRRGGFKGWGFLKNPNLGWGLGGRGK